jgi:hypothetical protein
MKEIRTIWHANTWGFMDYIRSIMLLDQSFGQKYKICPVISPQLSLSKAFDWVHDTYVNSDECLWLCATKHNSEQAVQKISDASQHSEILNVVTNVGPKNFEGCSKYQWLLTLNQKYDSLVTNRINSVVSGDYCIVHVRACYDILHADRHMNAQGAFGFTIIDYYEHAIPHIINKYCHGQQVVLLADHVDIRAIFDQYIQPPTRPSHSGDICSDDNLIDMLTDMKLICNAKSIISITNGPYEWVNFTMIPSFIYNIPLKMIGITKNLEQL